MAMMSRSTGCGRPRPHGKQWIIDLETSEREKTGIRSLKVGYNRVFGFYMEVTRSNLAQVPENYIRKQTLANGERYITTELKEMEDTILGAEQKPIALEYEVFCQIRDQVATYIRTLQQTAQALATLDVLAGLAELADREKYCRPTVDVSDHPGNPPRPPSGGRESPRPRPLCPE